jgi:hypothetical protein
MNVFVFVFFFRHRRVFKQRRSLSKRQVHKYGWQLPLRVSRRVLFGTRWTYMSGYVVIDDNEQSVYSNRLNTIIAVHNYLLLYFFFRHTPRSLLCQLSAGFMSATPNRTHDEIQLLLFVRRARSNARMGFTVFEMPFAR